MNRRLACLALAFLTTLGCGGPSRESTDAAAPAPAPVPAPEATADEAASAPQAVELKPVQVKLTKLDEAPGMGVVRAYIDQFYRGELASLHEKFSAEMKETLTLDQFEAILRHVGEEYGEQTEIIAEDAQTKGDYRGFVRFARFDKTEEIIEIQCILRPDDSIAGFFVRPAERPDGDEAGGGEP